MARVAMTGLVGQDGCSVSRIPRPRRAPSDHETGTAVGPPLPSFACLVQPMCGELTGSFCCRCSVEPERACCATLARQKGYPAIRSWFGSRRPGSRPTICADSVLGKKDPRYARLAITSGAKRPPSARAIRHARLLDEITQVHVESRGIYGAHRVRAELVLGRGILMGHNAGAMLMQRSESASPRSGSATPCLPRRPGLSTRPRLRVA